MRYEQRMRKYWQKKLEDPLPKLPEDERIYLNVPYTECAVYGKGLRQVFALWVRPRAKVVVHGFVEPQPL